MARMLAAKTALMVRKDALGEDEGDAELGIEVRAKLERRIKNMEEENVCICQLSVCLYSTVVTCVYFKYQSRRCFLLVLLLVLCSW